MQYAITKDQLLTPISIILEKATMVAVAKTANPYELAILSLDKNLLLGYIKKSEFIKMFELIPKPKLIGELYE